MEPIKDDFKKIKINELKEQLQFYNNLRPNVAAF